MKRATWLGAVVVVPVALVLPGCGQAAEQAAEQAIEQGTGAEVDIEDDSVKVTDEEGNEFAAGGDVSLPDSWPAEVPAPPGELLFAGSSAAGGVTGSWQVDASVGDVIADYADALAGAGFAAGEDSDLGGAKTRTFEGNNLLVEVIAVQSATTDGTTLTVSVSQVE